MKLKLYSFVFAIAVAVSAQQLNAQSFTPTDMATLNGVAENSITLSPSANLTGSFPYEAANGSNPSANMITVVGLVNGAGQWVGGAPQVVYNAVPSQSGSSGTANWSNLVVPSSAGTYQLYFQTFMNANASSDVSAFESSPPTSSGLLSGIVATVIVQASGPPTFTPTAMATLNGTQENSINLTLSADLSGSFPYLAADGGSAGQNMITVVGLVNGSGQWVGGAPQVVYNSVPSGSGSSGTANWSNLVVPSSAGTYQLWFESFLTTSTSSSVNSFEASPPTASGDLAGIVATVVVGGPPTFTPTAMATLNGTQENSITLTPGADLSGSFPYLAADGGSAGQNMITIVGLLNNAGQWVGGSPQVVYNGVPSQGGSSGTADWSNLAAPASAGTYQLWFQSFLTTDTSGSINSFEESPPTASGDLAGIVATAVVEQSSPTPVIVGAQGINWWSGNTPSTPSLSLSSGNQLYVYGATTGGGSSMSAFANGQTVQLQNGAGNVSAELAVTANSNNSYTTGTAYDAFGGLGVSGFNFAQGFYGVNPGPGPNLQASVQFTLSAPALVVVMGMGSSQATMTLSGLDNPTIDVSEVDGVYEPVLGIEHEYLGAGTYTVQVTTGDGTSYIQTPSHEVDLIGVLIFSTSPNVATSSYPQIPVPAFQPPSVPIVTTGSASGVTANSATLSGSANPNGLATTFYFQFGTSTAYGTTITPSQNSVGSGTTAQNIYAQNVSGLNPNTTYHFRLVADNSTGPAYGLDQTFTTLSGGTTLPVISPTYSTLILTPTSQPADGLSQITATATLRDTNNNPITGRTIEFSASGQATVKIANSTVTTDSNGKAMTTITATTPGTSTVCLIDPVNVNLIASATATFTQATVPTPLALSNAIVTLYQDSANYLDGTVEGFDPSVTSVPISVVPIYWLAPSEGNIGDYFQNQASAAQDAEVVDLVFGGIGLGGDIAGPATSLEDFAETELLSAGNSLADYNLSSIANLNGGCSYIAQGITYGGTQYQMALQSQANDLFSGIPQSSANLATTWTNDLQSRLNANHVLMGIAAQQDTYLLIVSNAWQVTHSPVQSLEQGGLEAVAVGAAQFVPGVDVAVDCLLLANSEYQDSQSFTGAQNNFALAQHILFSCWGDTSEIYSNSAAGFSEIENGSAPNTVASQILGGYTMQVGYQSQVPGSWLSLNGPTYATVITNVYSMVNVQNMGTNTANFEVVALYSYSNNIFSALPSTSIAQLSNVGAGQSSSVELEYFDGNIGALPNTADPIQIYLLGINNTGIFYGGSTNFTPSTFQLTSDVRAEGSEGLSKNPTPLDGGSDTTNNAVIENPIRCQVAQNSSNQTYQATIWISNPFNLPLTATVTQSIPPGMDVLATAGTNEISSIVWTNTVSTTNIIEDTFIFSLPVTPGAQTNLPAPTVLFSDSTGTNSVSFQSVAPAFVGLFPVQVNASIPVGVAGVDTPLNVTVTNLTGTEQTGSLTVTLTDSSGNPITNFSKSFSVDVSDSTNFEFTLPGYLSVGSYFLTGSLSINGGTGQVLAGTYIVPAPPIMLAPASTTALTTNGFGMALQGPAGNYLIEASSDLSSSTNWQPILFYSSTNSPFYYYFTDPNATNFSQQFYRAVMQ